MKRSELGYSVAAGFLAMTASMSFYFYKLHPDGIALGSDDPLYQLIGSSKEAIGDTLFLKADEYFHGGAQFKHGEEPPEAIEREGFIAEADREDGDEDEHRSKPAVDFIKKINDQITFTQHHHLEGDQAREMLPLLAGAVSLDPHNVEAILTTAYWLSQRLDKSDEAIILLKKAIHENPDAWELYGSLGRIYFKKKNNSKAALHFLGIAAQKLKKTPDFEKKDLASQNLELLMQKVRNAH